MSASAPSSVTERFSTAMVALRIVLFKHCVRFGQPVMAVMRVVDYLRRADGRFQRLMERYRQGTLAPPPPRKPQPKREKPEASGEPVDKPKRFSRAFGWFAKLIRPDGFVFADHLRETLDDPETVAALAAGPQLGRVLRPLCQMFGVKADQIALPRRKRKPRPPDEATQARRDEREEMRAFRAMGKTSDRGSVVPPGHTFPTNERDWAIYWGRVHRADQRRKNKKSKSA